MTLLMQISPNYLWLINLKRRPIRLIIMNFIILKKKRMFSWRISRVKGKNLKQLLTFHQKVVLQLQKV